MKYLTKIFLTFFISSVLFCVSSLAAGAPVDFFAARAFGGDKPAFYVLKPGDFDGDGRVDALVSGLRDVLVYYGDGTGKFSTPGTLIENSGGSPYFPVAADFNADGRSDFAVRVGSSLRVYFGNADRTFSAPVVSGGDPLPRYMEAVDFDGDTKLDLVGGGSGSNGSAISFYKGAGDGTFSYIEKIDTQYEVLPIIADFNNDTRPDVLFTNADAHRISLNTNGHFGAPVTINVDPLRDLQGVGDFNGDGLKDIVTTDGTFDPYMTIWLGAANLTFTEGEDAQFPLNERIFLKAIADINNDQKSDLIFNSLNQTLVRRGNGNGTFTPADFYGEGGNGDLFVRDINGDNWLDVVGVQPTQFAVGGSGSFAVLFNMQNGRLKSAPTLSTGSGTREAVIADLNADQLKDFVIVNESGGGAGGGDVVVIFQLAARGAQISGTEKFEAGRVAGGLLIDPNGVATGDFTGDGRVDIIVVGRAISGGANGLLLRNLGGNSFSLSYINIGAGENFKVAAADLNSDGKLDLATTSQAGVSISFGNGNGTFAAPTSYLASIFPGRLALADFNNDTKPDIAASTSGNVIGILINNGGGTFTNPGNPTVADGMSGVAAADMNSDGKIDLIASKFNSVAVLNGNGNGTFGAEATYPFSSSLSVNLAVADLNGDQKPDAAVIRGSNVISIMLNNGAGGLGNETLWSAGVSITTIAAGDINNDQKIDLAAGYTTSYDGYLKLLFNVTAPVELSGAPFDFDGDGKTDISIYRPSLGEWWYLRSSDGGNFAAQFGAPNDRIVPGDFTGDGKTDVAIWRPASGEWFVLRSEDQSYYSFPFGTNGDIPTVGDFDGDNKADATIFRPSTATWYVSRSSGGTTIQQFGLTGDVPVPADYDGDGKADIAIYRVAQGEWWIQRSTAGLIAFQFGNSSDKPVQGDYTGDGKADVAIWRPSSGEWFVLRSEDQSYYSFPFGTSGDVPAPGDYDGDGKFDAGVFRPSGSTWYVQRSTAGTLIQTFGQSGDTPVPNAFVP